MKQADSAGVRPAKDTVGWIKESMIVLYEASFSAHFSLDGPKIGSDDGSEKKSEGHCDGVSWLSYLSGRFLPSPVITHSHLFLPNITENHHQGVGSK